MTAGKGMEMKNLITTCLAVTTLVMGVTSDVMANTDNKHKNTTPNCAIGNITHDDGCCTVVIPDEQSNSTSRVIGCEDDAIIDVLWVYTQQALDYIGNEEGVLLQCQIAVDDANETFANTELPFSVRIVGLHYTDYTETADYLSHLQNPNDGYMDEVHPLRDAKAADIVVLITETGSCGLAYVSPSNPAYGFQECSAGCLVEDWAHPFRHELGHNLGSQHYTTDTYGYFSWSSGHRLTPDGGEAGACCMQGGNCLDNLDEVQCAKFGGVFAGVGTVCADDPCDPSGAFGDECEDAGQAMVGEIGTAMGGNDIPYFSNPNVFYGGVPTGYPIGPDEEADNYSAFMVTVPMVADFRCSESACRADVNVNGTIEVNDLLEVIDAWGPCASCPADVVFDGIVDVSDLLLVVGNWGPCP